MFPPQGMPPQGAPGMDPMAGAQPPGQAVDPAMVQQILRNKPLLDAIMQAIVQQAQSQQGTPPGGAMPPGAPMPPM